MSFKETFLYRAFSDLWGNWSSLNWYSAALSAPLFLWLAIVIVITGILVDGFFACKELV